MGFALTKRDRDRLRGVHPDLVRVVERAAEISPIPFMVVEGLRTLERQRKLKAQGLSKTLNSRHLTGHAVDLVPIVDLDGSGKVDVDEMYHHSQLEKLAPHIKRAFKIEGVPYDWGGDWPRAWDKPHWQLPWRRYPIQTASIGTIQDSIGDLSEALVEDPMEGPVVTPNAARMIGSSSAGLGGVGLVTQAATDIASAEDHLNAGTIIGLIVGSLIIVGGLLALWDALGRPTPWRRA